MSFLDLCRHFIGIDTSPQAGTLEAANWLKQLALGYGMNVDLQEENYYGLEQANIFIRRGEKKEKEFLLQSHFDTANPGPHSLWTENRMNPFHAIIQDGKLYGLGACEAKIDLLCKIEALKSFNENQKWTISPVVAGTFGEEIGMQGLSRAFRKNKFNAQYALVGEPSGHRLIYAGKGYALLDFYIPFSKDEKEYRIDHNIRESVSTHSKIFKGRATHSSEEGVGSENAINKALEYLIQIPENVVIMEIEGGTNHNLVASHVFLEVDIGGGVMDPMVKKLKHIYWLMQQIGSDFLIAKNSEFSTGHPTMNLGLIKSQEDHVHLTVACRFPPAVSEELYLNWLEKVQKSTLQIGGECRVTDYKRPYRTDLGSEFVKICQSVLENLEMSREAIALPVCTEMTLYERKGVVSLGFGAGIRGNSQSFCHQFVDIRDLEKSIQFYRDLIERVCL